MEFVVGFGFRFGGMGSVGLVWRYWFGAGARCTVGPAERRRKPVHGGLSAASMLLILSSGPTAHHAPLVGCYYAGIGILST